MCNRQFGKAHSHNVSQRPKYGYSQIFSLKIACFKSMQLGTKIEMALIEVKALPQFCTLIFRNIRKALNMMINIQQTFHASWTRFTHVIPQASLTIFGTWKDVIKHGLSREVTKYIWSAWNLNLQAALQHQAMPTSRRNLGRTCLDLCRRIKYYKFRLNRYSSQNTMSTFQLVTDASLKSNFIRCCPRKSWNSE